MTRHFHRGAAIFSCLLLAGMGVWLWPKRVLGQENEDDKLKRGDILISFRPSPFSDLSEVTGVILFNAPLAIVWKVLTNYDDYARFLPDISQSKVERKEGAVVWQRVEVHNLWPLPDFHYLLKITNRPEAGEIGWQMLEGNLKNLYGRWKLEPFAANPNQTKAMYTLLQDPGGFFGDLTQNFSTRSLVLERLDAFHAEIQLEKTRQDGQPERVIRPNWRKAIFWWEELEPPRFRAENKPPPPEPAPAKPKPPALP